MISRVSTLLVLASVAACGGNSMGRSSETPVTVHEVPSPFARWEGMWAELGLTQASEVHSRFLTRGQSLTLPWALANGECQLAISRAEGSLSDVDAYVFEGDGRLITRDTSERAGGYSAVIVCARGDERQLHIHWRAVRGAGRVHTLFLRVPRPALLTTAERLQAVRARAESQGWSRVDTWLQGIRRRGFSLRGEVHEVAVGRGETVRLGLRLRGPECVTVAGFGGRGIERLSLRIVDAVGRTVAETGADGRDAFVQACSEHPVDWSVVVMAAEGGGVIQYLRLDGDPMLVPNRSSLWYGERRRVEVHDSEARLRGLLAVLGLRQSRSVSRERLQHGEVRASEHTIRGGPCVAVLGTATQGAPLAIGISRGGVAGSIPPRQSGNPVALQLWCDGRESRRVRVELAAPLAAVDAVITIATGENPLGGESSAQSLLDAFADELAEGWRLIPELHRRVEGSGEEAIAWPDGEGCVRARWVGEEGTRATLSTQVEAEDDARDIGPDARITRCAAPRPDALSLQLQEIAEAGGWLLWLRPEAEPPTRRR